MHTKIDDALARISERHDGVFSFAHTVEVGMDKSTRTRRLESGAFIPVGAAAYRFRGTPLTWRGQARAALWDAGPDAVLSHDAAGRLHRFPGFHNGGVEVLVPRALDHVCTIA